LLGRKAAPTVTVTPAAYESLSSLGSVPVPVTGALGGDVITASYGALYRNQPAVQTVIGFLAQNIAQLNVKTYRRIGNENRQQLPNHPAAQLLRRPNHYTTRYRMMEATVADFYTYGNAFWWKMRVGAALMLVRLPPEIVMVSGPAWVRPTSYTIIPNLFFGNQATFVVQPADMVHFRTYDPTDLRMGVSPLVALRAVLMEDADSRIYHRRLWRKGARMEGVIERPVDAPAWTDTARKRFREEFQATYAGVENSGKTGILEEGMTFRPYSWSPKDTEWIAGRKLTLEEVARELHVPLSMVGLQSNFAVVTEEHKMMYQDTLGPPLEMFEEEFQLQLLPDFDDQAGIYFEFNLQDKLKGSYEMEASILTTAAGRPWLTVNEARARQNLSPIPNGDELTIPLNVVLAGGPQAAPNLPTADPSTPPPAGQAALPAPQVKAIGVPRSAIRRRNAAAAEHEKALATFFRKQRRSVTSNAKSRTKATIGDVWKDYWDKDLAAILYALATKTAGDAAMRVVQDIGGTYDSARTQEYLAQNAQFAAESINRTTRQAVVDALDDPETLDGVFDVAIEARAPEAGLSRATELIAFGSHEAAYQNHVTNKVWVVTSTNSRHPELDGETVGMDDTFSNQLAYPGDPAGDPSETCRCECLLDFETETP